MGLNPLDPGSTAGRPDRDLNRGHGTRALGPGDSSDSASDLVGAPDPEEAPQLDAATEDAADIDADHIESLPEGVDEDEELKDVPEDLDKGE